MIKKLPNSNKREEKKTGHNQVEKRFRTSLLA